MFQLKPRPHKALPDKNFMRERERGDGGDAHHANDVYMKRLCGSI